MAYGPYQSADEVTPHAANINAYRALLVSGTTTAGSVTFTSAQGQSVAVVIPVNAVVLIPVATRLVTAASNCTVVGLN